MAAKELISNKTRYVFREYLVGWTLREIEGEFDAAGIDCDEEYAPPMSGQRRCLVEQFYRTVDFTDAADVRKVLQVYENILVHLEGEIDNEHYRNRDDSQQSFARLTRWLKKDGFLYRDEGLVAIGASPVTPRLKTMAEMINAPYIVRQVERIENEAESDPRLAIGTAKELVESVCKMILTDRGKPIEKGWDVLALVKATRKELQLTPDDIPDSAKASDSMKRLLMNLASVVQGLAEVRNLFGTGHGHDGRARGLQPRHARLVAGAAATLATFLFETHEARTDSEG